MIKEHVYVCARSCVCVCVSVCVCVRVRVREASRYSICPYSLLMIDWWDLCEVRADVWIRLPFCSGAGGDLLIHFFDDHHGSVRPLPPCSHGRQLRVCGLQSWQDHCTGLYMTRERERESSLSIADIPRQCCKNCVFVHDMNVMQGLNNASIDGWSTGFSLSQTMFFSPRRAFLCDPK